MVLVHNDHIAAAMGDADEQSKGDRDAAALGVCEGCLFDLLDAISETEMVRTMTEGERRWGGSEISAFGQGVMIGVRACQIAIAETN